MILHDLYLAACLIIQEIREPLKWALMAIEGSKSDTVYHIVCPNFQIQIHIQALDAFLESRFLHNASKVGLVEPGIFDASTENLADEPVVCFLGCPWY